MTIIARANCERLPLATGSVDAIVTDPPYQVGLNPDTCGWDVWPDPGAWRELHRVARPGSRMAFTIAPHVAHERVPDVVAAGWRVLEVGFWVYGNGRPVAADRPKRSYDLVYFMGKGARGLFVDEARGEFASEERKGRVNAQTRKLGAQFSKINKLRSYTFGADYHPANVACEAGCDAFGRTDYGLIFAVKRMRGAGRIHLTEKPIELIAQLVRLVSQPGDLVLDPFGGSASTMEACARLGRRWVYADLLQENATKARGRMAQSQPPLFAEVQP